jgi:hypothetical protein
MWSLLLVIFFTIIGLVTADEPFNHPAKFAAGIQSAGGKNLSGVGNFVLVNQCDYPIYYW